ncbi:YceI family protein [uncultured Thermanaerothrix sp.]|uniref:YceI family protein n=1 Tax=uncultured Thermanaerothrix sp. TaxID=1195149 RepID=UPI00262E161B|nr:YceI family protein [uncultured Thermanaerothrix sp.]
MSYRLAGLGLVLLGLGLLACVPAPPMTSPAPTSTPALPSSTSVPTEPPPATATAPVPTAAAAGRANSVIFRIVPGESQASYEVGETFFNQNNRFNIAVGVTTAIEGQIEANLADPPASRLGPITVDVSQLRSDSSRRDNYLRNNALESARYPLVTFTPTAVEGLPTAYVEGQDYTFRVRGDLTVRQTTRPVTFAVTARLEGQTLSGTATTTILMSDFGIGPIDLVGILRTEDAVKLTLTFTARP